MDAKLLKVLTDEYIKESETYDKEMDICKKKREDGKWGWPPKKSKVKRLGILIRQKMVEYEKEME